MYCKKIYVNSQIGSFATLLRELLQYILRIFVLKREASNTLELGIAQLSRVNRALWRIADAVAPDLTRLDAEWRRSRENERRTNGSFVIASPLSFNSTSEVLNDIEIIYVQCTFVFVKVENANCWRVDELAATSSYRED